MFLPFAVDFGGFYLKSVGLDIMAFVTFFPLLDLKVRSAVRSAETARARACGSPGDRGAVESAPTLTLECLLGFFGPFFDCSPTLEAYRRRNNSTGSMLKKALAGMTGKRDGGGLPAA